MTSPNQTADSFISSIRPEGQKSSSDNRAKALLQSAPIELPGEIILPASNYLETHPDAMQLARKLADQVIKVEDFSVAQGMGAFRSTNRLSLRALEQIKSGSIKEAEQTLQDSLADFNLNTVANTDSRIQDIRSGLHHTLNDLRSYNHTHSDASGLAPIGSKEPSGHKR